MTFADIRRRMNELKSDEVAKVLRVFFKIGPGQYGEGDVFIGIKTEPLRELAKECRDISLPTIKRLLFSKVHEERTLALMVLVDRYRLQPESRDEIYAFYLDHTARINNWDLVDCSAPGIVGMHLLERSKQPLYRLARSPMLWERRIAIVATLKFIRHDLYEPTVKVSEILLADEHDLIHKAAGWMLREMGKRDIASLEAFLETHRRVMPRTMLRYAIERMSEAKRRYYMAR